MIKMMVGAYLCPSHLGVNHHAHFDTLSCRILRWSPSLQDNARNDRPFSFRKLKLIFVDIIVDRYK